MSLDLYFSGVSLRNVACSVNDRFGVEVNFSTIDDGIQKYIPLISDCVNTFTPQLSETWHADGLFVRMKGNSLQGRYKGLALLWNVMDKGTRFLLASRVSENRGASGAVAAFQEAIKNAKHNLPNTINTDAHRSSRGVSKTIDATNI